MTTTNIRLIFDETRPNAACRISVVGDFPALVGSEKQAAWALDIRATAAREIAEYIAKVIKLQVPMVTTREVDHPIVAETHAALDASRSMPGADKAYAAIDAIFAEASAKWWIEHGRAAPIVLIQDKVGGRS